MSEVMNKTIVTKTDELEDSDLEPLGSYFWKQLKKNRLALASLYMLIFIHVLIFIVPLIYTVSPEAIDPVNALEMPSAQHWLGTDETGRDTLSRLLYGGRISIVVGTTSMLITILVGTILGALSGYYGGIIDMVIMRFTDALMSIPQLFLLLIILSIFGGSTLTIILVLGLTSWMGTGRIVRGEVLRWKQEDFVEAERSLGAKNARIIIKHILPNTFSSIIVAATLQVARSVLRETALSYLGLGIQPPTPSLGNMLTNSQIYIWNSPLQAVWPGLLILLIVLCYNFLGDGLRTALDPRMKR